MANQLIRLLFIAYCITAALRLIWLAFEKPLCGILGRLTGFKIRVERVGFFSLHGVHLSSQRRCVTVGAISLRLTLPLFSIGKAKDVTPPSWKRDFRTVFSWGLLSCLIPRFHVLVSSPSVILCIGQPESADVAHTSGDSGLVIGNMVSAAFWLVSRLVFVRVKNLEIVKEMDLGTAVLTSVTEVSLSFVSPSTRVIGVAGVTGYLSGLRASFGTIEIPLVSSVEVQRTAQSEAALVLSLLLFPITGSFPRKVRSRTELPPIREQGATVILSNLNVSLLAHGDEHGTKVGAFANVEIIKADCGTNLVSILPHKDAVSARPSSQGSRESSRCVHFEIGGVAEKVRARCTFSEPEGGQDVNLLLAGDVLRSEIGLDKEISGSADAIICRIWTSDRDAKKDAELDLTRINSIREQFGDPGLSDRNVLERIEKVSAQSDLSGCFVVLAGVEVIDKSRVRIPLSKGGPRLRGARTVVFVDLDVTEAINNVLPPLLKKSVRGANKKATPTTTTSSGPARVSAGQIWVAVRPKVGCPRSAIAYLRDAKWRADNRMKVADICIGASVGSNLSDEIDSILSAKCDNDLVLDAAGALSALGFSQNGMIPFVSLSEMRWYDALVGVQVVIAVATPEIVECIASLVSTALRALPAFGGSDDSARVDASTSTKEGSVSKLFADSATVTHARFIFGGSSPMFAPLLHPSKVFERSPSGKPFDVVPPLSLNEDAMPERTHHQVSSHSEPVGPTLYIADVARLEVKSLPDSRKRSIVFDSLDAWFAECPADVTNDAEVFADAPKLLSVNSGEIGYTDSFVNAKRLFLVKMVKAFAHWSVIRQLCINETVREVRSCVQKVSAMLRGNKPTAGDTGKSSSSEGSATRVEYHIADMVLEAVFMKESPLSLRGSDFVYPWRKALSSESDEPHMRLLPRDKSMFCKHAVLRVDDIPTISSSYLVYKIGVDSNDVPPFFESAFHFLGADASKRRHTTTHLVFGDTEVKIPDKFPFGDHMDRIVKGVNVMKKTFKRARTRPRVGLSGLDHVTILASKLSMRFLDAPFEAALNYVLALNQDEQPERLERQVLLEQRIREEMDEQDDIEEWTEVEALAPVVPGFVDDQVTQSSLAKLGFTGSSASTQDDVTRLSWKESLGEITNKVDQFRKALDERNSKIYIERARSMFGSVGTREGDLFTIVAEPLTVFVCEDPRLADELVTEIRSRDFHEHKEDQASVEYVAPDSMAIVAQTNLLTMQIRDFDPLYIVSKDFLFQLDLISAAQIGHSCYDVDRAHNIDKFHRFHEVKNLAPPKYYTRTSMLASTFHYTLAPAQVPAFMSANDALELLSSASTNPYIGLMWYDKLRSSFHGDFEFVVSDDVAVVIHNSSLSPYDEECEKLTIGARGATVSGNLANNYSIKFDHMSIFPSTLPDSRKDEWPTAGCLTIDIKLLYVVGPGRETTFSDHYVWSKSQPTADPYDCIRSRGLHLDYNISWTDDSGEKDGAILLHRLSDTPWVLDAIRLTYDPPTFITYKSYGFDPSRASRRARMPLRMSFSRLISTQVINFNQEAVGFALEATDLASEVRDLDHEEGESQSRLVFRPRRLALCVRYTQKIVPNPRVLSARKTVGKYSLDVVAGVSQEAYIAVWSKFFNGWQELVRVTSLDYSFGTQAVHTQNKVLDPAANGADSTGANQNVAAGLRGRLMQWKSSLKGSPLSLISPFSSSSKQRQPAAADEPAKDAAITQPQHESLHSLVIDGFYVTIEPGLTGLADEWIVAFSETQMTNMPHRELLDVKFDHAPDTPDFMPSEAFSKQEGSMSDAISSKREVLDIDVGGHHAGLPPFSPSRRKLKKRVLGTSKLTPRPSCVHDTVKKRVSKQLGERTQKFLLQRIRGSVDVSDFQVCLSERGLYVKDSPEGNTARSLVVAVSSVQAKDSDVDHIPGESGRTVQVVEARLRSLAFHIVDRVIGGGFSATSAEGAPSLMKMKFLEQSEIGIQCDESRPVMNCAEARAQFRLNYVKPNDLAIPEPGEPEYRFNSAVTVDVPNLNCTMSSDEFVLTVELVTSIVTLGRGKVVNEEEKRLLQAVIHATQLTSDTMGGRALDENLEFVSENLIQTEKLIRQKLQVRHALLRRRLARSEADEYTSALPEELRKEVKILKREARKLKKQQWALKQMTQISGSDSALDSRVPSMRISCSVESGELRLLDFKKEGVDVVEDRGKARLTAEFAQLSANILRYRVHKLSFDTRFRELLFAELDPHAPFPVLLQADTRRDLETEPENILRIFAKQGQPVGGIPVFEHIELSVSPILVQLTHDQVEFLNNYFLPERVDGKTSDVVVYVPGETAAGSASGAEAVEPESAGSLEDAFLSENEYVVSERFSNAESVAGSAKDHYNPFALIISPPAKGSLQGAKSNIPAGGRLDVFLSPGRRSDMKRHRRSVSVDTAQSEKWRRVQERIAQEDLMNYASMKSGDLGFRSLDNKLSKKTALPSSLASAFLDDTTVDVSADRRGSVHKHGRHRRMHSDGVLSNFSDNNARASDSDTMDVEAPLKSQSSAKGKHKDKATSSGSKNAKTKAPVDSIETMVERARTNKAINYFKLSNTTLKVSYQSKSGQKAMRNMHGVKVKIRPVVYQGFTGSWKLLFARLRRDMVRQVLAQAARGYTASKLRGVKKSLFWRKKKANLSTTQALTPLASPDLRAKRRVTEEAGKMRTPNAAPAASLTELFLQGDTAKVDAMESNVSDVPGADHADSEPSENGLNTVADPEPTAEASSFPEVAPKSSLQAFLG